MPDRRYRRAAAAAAAAAVLAAAATVAVTVPGVARSHPAPPVKTAQSPRLGATILVDRQGRTLYHLTTESTRTFVCVGSCTALWPPLVVRSRGDLPRARSGALAKLHVVHRPDGRLQVAHGNEPLYRFANDRAAGDTNGEGFAGTWFSIRVGRTVAQQPAQTAPPPAQPSPEPSPGYPPAQTAPAPAQPSPQPLPGYQY